jgi:hypothetical protein
LTVSEKPFDAIIKHVINTETNTKSENIFIKNLQDIESSGLLKFKKANSVLAGGSLSMISLAIVRHASKFMKKDSKDSVNEKMLLLKKP